MAKVEKTDTNYQTVSLKAASSASLIICSTSSDFSISSVTGMEVKTASSV